MKTCGCPSDTLSSLLMTLRADRVGMNIGAGARGDLFGEAFGVDLLRPANDDADHAAERRVVERLAAGQLAAREGDVVVMHGGRDRGVLGVEGLHEHASAALAAEVPALSAVPARASPGSRPPLGTAWPGGTPAFVSHTAPVLFMHGAHLFRSFVVSSRCLNDISLTIVNASLIPTDRGRGTRKRPGGLALRGACRPGYLIGRS